MKRLSKRRENMVSKFRLERLARGVTQIDVWHVTGIPQWRTSLIERGVLPTLEEAEQLSEFLGVPVDALFEIKDGRILGSKRVGAHGEMPKEGGRHE
jgi:transcriptional regulator with XRE-family HTH domain